MKVALYARVSTKDQTAENQLQDLRRFCGARGWDIFKEFVDTISGETDQRPALDECMQLARRRQIDVLLVWHFDRFARSTVHAVLTMNELKNLGVNFVSLQQGIDTTTPIGQAMFTISAAFAELELTMIRERVRAGLRRAREAGTQLGRPAAEFDIEKANQLRAQGLSLREIAGEVTASAATLSRVFHKPRKELMNTSDGEAH